MQPPCPPGSAPALRPGPQRARDPGPLWGALQWSGDWARGCRPAPHLSVTCVSALGPWAPQVVLVVKSPPVNSGDIRDAGLIPGSGRSPEKEMATHSSTLTGKSHGQRSLAGCSPRSRRESDTAWHAPLPKATAASAGQGAALWWGAQGHRSCQSHPRGSSSPCWGIPWGEPPRTPQVRRSLSPGGARQLGERGGVVTTQCRPWGTWPSVSLPAGDMPRTRR